MRILALDVGDRHIGVAVSDPTGLLARPLTIIARKGMEADIEAIRKIVSQDTGKVIVGLPLSLDGRVGEQAAKVQVFAERLKGFLTVPLELRDERFSTVAVKEHRAEMGDRKKKRRAPDDAEAAAVILQGYLDENR